MDQVVLEALKKYRRELLTMFTKVKDDGNDMQNKVSESKRCYLLDHTIMGRD
jgi:hypothetical protein